MNLTTADVVARRGRLVPADRLGRVHFIGIGGTGMSGIARIMLARGMHVSGSDARESRVLDALRALGAEITVGQSAENIGAVDAVVVTSAIREDNPEYRAAVARGLRLLHRSEALASLMVGHPTIAVAGTHGKTTTTSMTTVVLQASGRDPSFVIGGVLNASGTNAHDGTGEWFVAEADESDGSFLLYSPQIEVVTNVEADHLDHYGTPSRYAEAFDAFAERLRAQDGLLVACADDPGAAALAARVRARGRRTRTYGTVEAADVRAVDIDLSTPHASFEPVVAGRRLGRVTLQLPGLHNVLDACGALAAATAAGVPDQDARRGLEAFSGTRRRFEAKGEAWGVRVFDDYAHHPTEVATVIAAAREVAGPGRVVAVFQPHLYSRTEAFAAEFAHALSAADLVFVMDVFAAREDPVPGVSGALISSRVDLPPEAVQYLPRWSEAAGQVCARLTPGDVVLTIGAGDITLIGPEILRELTLRPGSQVLGRGTGAPA